MNPEDGKITPYYALSIIQKYWYKNISALLQEQRPDLFLNYEKLLQSNSENALQLIGNVNAESLEISQFVPETFMYGTSRIFRSLQYLVDVNVIRLWNDKVMEIQINSSGNMEIGSADGKDIRLSEPIND